MLRQVPHWIVCGTDKIPRNPETLHVHDAMDENAHVTFDRACEVASANGLHIGYVWTDHEQRSVVIDLDDHGSNDAKDVEDHEAIFESARVHGCYIERSISGKGYHVIAPGKVTRAQQTRAVSVYGARRFVLLTGDVVQKSSLFQKKTGDENGVGPHAELLGQQVANYIAPSAIYEYDPVADKEQRDDDDRILERARGATNAEKFEALYAGHWHQASDAYGRPFPSQSEADSALLALLDTYSGNEEQIIRMFKDSGLYRASKKGDYIERTLRFIRKRKARLAQIVTLDFLNAPPVTAPVKSNVYEMTTPHQVWPPGKLGDICRSFFGAVLSQEREFAICAATTLCAGILARSYQVGTAPKQDGLNLYQIVLARTGKGKEIMSQIIDNVMKRLADDRGFGDFARAFQGPSHFASKPGLHKRIARTPCFFSILPEFSETLECMAGTRIDPQQKGVAQLMKTLYNKSGGDVELHGSEYSEKEKNAPPVRTPCLTLLAETTPKAFYDVFNEAMISDGLMPRFLITELRGVIKEVDESALRPIEDATVDLFADMINVAKNSEKNGLERITVAVNEPARDVLRELEKKRKEIINNAIIRGEQSGDEEISAELWNRATQNATRLAALCAVVDNLAEPIITREHAQWAVKYASYCVSTTRLRADHSDSGAMACIADVRNTFLSFATLTEKQRTTYKITDAAFEKGVLSKIYISRRNLPRASFLKTRSDGGETLKRVLSHLLSTGEIIELNEDQRAEIGVIGLGQYYKATSEMIQELAVNDGE